MYEKCKYNQIYQITKTCQCLTKASFHLLVTLQIQKLLRAGSFSKLLNTTTSPKLLPKTRLKTYPTRALRNDRSSSVNAFSVLNLVKCAVGARTDRQIISRPNKWAP